ncbi:phosphotransacetylase family protein [Oscillatoria sp. FACHB-1407]|uniref:phosphotransacetylase family protein n=1 Tax=Oscillatoria sp. FACHB-1407 TaxID=2692847 RepID=UPI001688E676|nr:DRTGG domain-containing protein [Oscillatoria sp. FACHB-1407]MBD2464930.1 phosphotransacetylase family protein [Oscillatoria sp. FACHB-1407]
MPKSVKHLLIGSPEAYSGKSAIILGIAHRLQQQGLSIAYGKPLGTCLSESECDAIDEDVRFIAETLNLTDDHLRPTLISLDEATINRRLSGEDKTDYHTALRDYAQLLEGDLVLLEGPGTLSEGKLFELSLLQVAQAIDAAVVLVTRFQSGLVVDALLTAKESLGDRLVGVLINDVPTEQFELANRDIKAFLEEHDIPVLGILPRNDLLRSVSVRELVHQLNAEVLCRPDRLDLMVESLKIGAMNVNAALKYFRTSYNMAVVTGGDRTDIQVAALETSTHCLILTGQIPPLPTVVNRAEELEIPILSVDLDTLTTVEIIDRTFGRVRLHEPVKVQCIRQLMEKHFDSDRLLSQLGLEAFVKA